MASERDIEVATDWPARTTQTPVPTIRIMSTTVEPAAELFIFSTSSLPSPPWGPDRALHLDCERESSHLAPEAHLRRRKDVFTSNCGLPARSRPVSLANPDGGLQCGLGVIGSKDDVEEACVSLPSWSFPLPVGQVPRRSRQTVCHGPQYPNFPSTPRTNKFYSSLGSLLSGLVEHFVRTGCRASGLSSISRRAYGNSRTGSRPRSTCTATLAFGWVKKGLSAEMTHAAASFDGPGDHDPSTERCGPISCGLPEGLRASFFPWNCFDWPVDSSPVRLTIGFEIRSLESGKKGNGGVMRKQAPFALTEQSGPDGRPTATLGSITNPALAEAGTILGMSGPRSVRSSTAGTCREKYLLRVGPGRSEWTSRAWSSSLKGEANQLSA